MDTLSSTDVFFQQRRDCTGKLDLSVQQKCSTAIRDIGNGYAVDGVDEYLNVAESTAADCLTHFVDGIIANSKDCYMRQPNAANLAKLLHEGERRKFPAMMGSIDCMHWTWKKCPKELQGQFRMRAKKATVILEAVASQDLWIWHDFFGNRVHVMILMSLIDLRFFITSVKGKHQKLYGERESIPYEIPKMRSFYAFNHNSPNRKAEKICSTPRGIIKDVERAFGVLQARFAIIRHGALFYKVEIMNKIMLACIIMHNMIVEDERDTYLNYTDPSPFIEDRAATSSAEDYMESSTNRIVSLEAYMRRKSEVRDTDVHKALKNDLIQNVWAWFRHE